MESHQSCASCICPPYTVYIKDSFYCRIMPANEQKWQKSTPFILTGLFLVFFFDFANALYIPHNCYQGLVGPNAKVVIIATDGNSLFNCPVLPVIPEVYHMTNWVYFIIKLNKFVNDQVCCHSNMVYGATDG